MKIMFFLVHENYVKRKKEKTNHYILFTSDRTFNILSDSLNSNKIKSFISFIFIS